MQHLNDYTFVVVDRSHFNCVFLNACSIRAFFKQKFKKNLFSTLKSDVSISPNREVSLFPDFIPTSQTQRSVLTIQKFNPPSLSTLRSIPFLLIFKSVNLFVILKRKLFESVVVMKIKR